MTKEDKQTCCCLWWFCPALLVLFPAVKYLKKYFGGGVCTSSARLDGKTVIITGANTGIGKETALDLAKRGAKVILACRDMEKANQAAKQIKEESANNKVFVKKLDLASLESVRVFANEINDEEERIDILINNAGIMACPHWRTKDNLEMQIGVNHFGHFYLTNLLLEKIKESAPSRIINVSSLAHERGRMDFDNLNAEKQYNSLRVYSQSKLANVLFTRELAKRLENTGVTTYALHPGAVITELDRYFGDVIGRFLFNILFFFFRPFRWLIFKDAKQGAQTTIYCAVDENLRNQTGRYYSDCKEKALGRNALNDQDAKTLWEMSEKIINDIKNKNK